MHLLCFSTKIIIQIYILANYIALTLNWNSMYGLVNPSHRHSHSVDGLRMALHCSGKWWRPDLQMLKKSEEGHPNYWWWSSKRWRKNWAQHLFNIIWLCIKKYLIDRKNAYYITSRKIDLRSTIFKFNI